MITGVLSDYAGYNVSLFGASDGFINTTVSGGTAPYSFLWSNGATTQNISGLTAGLYGVTVTDANGCVVEDSYTLSQPPPAANLEVLGTVTDVTCFGFSDGAIELFATGGVPPYNFAWSNGANTQNLSGLSGGVYGVTVTDQMSNSFIG